MVNLTHKTHHAMLAIGATLLLVACGQQGPDSQQPAAMPAMPVSVLEVQPATVPIQAEAVAQTEGAKEVEIRPRVGGIILKKLFEEGAEIKAGQPMFLIDPVPYKMKATQARAHLAQKNARVQQTKREAERLKTLLDTKSISQREYDNAVSDHAMADASVQEFRAMLHEAELNLSYATVKAPESGMAGRFQYSEGALVNANTSLLTTIVQTSPIWVRFSLSDSELTQLGGMLTSESVEGIDLILPDGTQYPETGKLNFSASSIDPALGTQQLRAEFKNADKKLIPGQFVRIRVTTGSNEGVFLVPQAAVLSSEQGKFVFVAETDDKGNTVAAVRPVQAGSWSGQDWVILGGLKQGDKVIVDNLIKVRPGAPVAPKQPAPPINNTADAPKNPDDKK
ncbi:MAG: efflux RND transporter periplasmic adaptor subunit [Methylophilaceae bacterium]|nr:efflux RND transporter periplasmic adaptor subunit [Methylophilaceae bacterium]